MSRPEYRFTRSELRAADDRTLSGYAAVFSSPSEDLGGFTETIRKGAFARAISSRQDVRCTIDHDYSRLLGRTKSGTLSLSEDDHGLKFKCSLPDTSYGRDLVESVRRGDITGCSFGFICRKNAWPRTDLGEVIDCDLFDVGPVCVPAYASTSVAARSITIDGHSRRIGVYQNTTSEPLPELERDRLRLRLELARLL